MLVSRPEKGFSRDGQGFLRDVRELDGESFVAFSSASVLSRVVHDELRRWGVTPAISATANNSAVILAYVQAGMGVTILEDFTVRNYQDVLDIYPLPGASALREYALITRSASICLRKARPVLRFCLRNSGEWNFRVSQTSF